MDYNEDDIIKKVKEWQPDVDTQQLWNSVRHEAPIGKKRRRYFILPLFLGLILGGMMMHLYKENYLKLVICDDSVLVDSLRNELTLANEKISKLNRVAQGYFVGDTKPTFGKYLYKSTGNQRKKVRDNVVNQEPESAYLFANTAQPLQPDSEPQQSQLFFQPINSLHILPNTKQDRVEMPILQRKASYFQNPDNKYAKSMEAGLGWAFVMGDNKIVPSSDFDGHRLRSNVQYLSWQVSKNLNNYWSTGLSFQLWRAQTAFGYNFSRQEEYEVIDTTQLIIDPAGNITPVLGNTTAIKLTETQGTFYLSDYRIGIMPSMALKWPLLGKWNLTHTLGIGTDILQINEQTPSFLANAGLWATRKSGLVLNPYITLSHKASYRLPNSDKAYIVFSLLYRKEKLPTQKSTNVHNLLIPTIGFGLSFEGRR